MLVKQIRTEDEVDGATKAREWLESLSKPLLAERSPIRHLESTTDNFRAGEGGGVIALWVDDRPYAMAVLHRDSRNFTITTLLKLDDREIA